ncbi:MAG: DUF6152 family protein [Rhodospirillaceae bacterium]|nr:DUF6152 family protein [Rhodospirillaceae bacterium]
MPTRTAWLIAAASVVFATAEGHHSSVPWYDLQADPVTVTGVVKEFQFINPHVYIILDVARDDGTVEEWKIESTSRNRLIRIGWTEDSIRAGQTVTATGFPAWEGNGVDSERIVVDDGALIWER